MMVMNEAFVIDILRTPIGSYGGALAGVRPDDLMALALKELLARNTEIDPGKIEDVIVGDANQAGEDNRNVARMALLLAGIPVASGGVTVNRLCASGLQAIMDASRALMVGEGEVYLAGGVESMSRAPYVMAKNEEPWSRRIEVADSTLGWRFTNQLLAKMYHPFSMGETAENVAEKWNIQRTKQDEFAFGSQQKYQAAHAAGKFSDELIPVPVTKGREQTLVSKDEHPRTTTLEKLATLRPVFRENGSVTAGNSSGINDGAAAAILAGESVAKYGKPMVRIVSMAVAGVDPAFMGMGPVPAVRKALSRAGLKLADIVLLELNEAFAAQALACIQELDLNPALVNVNGGAIALGHPLGSSGVRISATLIHEMMRRKVRYGIATMCVGVGQGAAIVYENCRS